MLAAVADCVTASGNLPALDFTTQAPLESGDFPLPPGGAPLLQICLQLFFNLSEFFTLQHHCVPLLTQVLLRELVHVLLKWLPFICGPPRTLAVSESSWLNRLPGSSQLLLQLVHCSS